MNSKLDRVVKTIRSLEGQISREYKAEIIGVFGFYARGEQKAGSDVDILVRFL